MWRVTDLEKKILLVVWRATDMEKRSFLVVWRVTNLEKRILLGGMRLVPKWHLNQRSKKNQPQLPPQTTKKVASHDYARSVKEKVVWSLGNVASEERGLDPGRDRTEQNSDHQKPGQHHSHKAQAMAGGRSSQVRALNSVHHTSRIIQFMLVSLLNV